MTDGAEEQAGQIAHGALRGVVAAMAMSGMRSFTTDVGLLAETPPRAILRQRHGWLVRNVPKRRRRATGELIHWGYGAAGGAAFAALPDGVRRRAWAGPAWGLLLWLGFELVQAPLLGLRQARKKGRAAEQAALALDHLLYGFVLSETRSRPRD